MKSTIFISGPHGAGKTTLINKLLSNHKLFLENTFNVDFLTEVPNIRTMTHFERCLFRLYHRIYCTNYAQQLAADYPKSVLLTSRGIYDSLAYVKSYKEFNWLSDEEFSKLNFIMDNSGYLPNTIVLNPLFETVKARLDQRRVVGSRKLRDQIFSFEDSDKFIKSLCKSFAFLADLKNVLYLEDNEDKDLEKILDWINS